MGGGAFIHKGFIFIFKVQIYYSEINSSCINQLILSGESLRERILSLIKDNKAMDIKSLAIKKSDFTREKIDKLYDT